MLLRAIVILICLGCSPSSEDGSADVFSGCALVDLDNDADLDVVTTAGVSDGYGGTTLDVVRIGHMTVLENLGMGFAPGGLVDRTADAGAELLDPMSGRGLAVGDYDRDGDVDILVGVDGDAKTSNGPQSLELRRTSMLFRNDSARAVGHQSLRLDLFQPGTANPFGVGARVDVSVGTKQTSRVLLAGSSCLSTHSYTLHSAWACRARPTGYVSHGPRVSCNCSWNGRRVSIAWKLNQTPRVVGMGKRVTA